MSTIGNPYYDEDLTRAFYRQQNGGDDYGFDNLTVDNKSALWQQAQGLYNQGRFNDVPQSNLLNHHAPTATAPTGPGSAINMNGADFQTIIGQVKDAQSGAVAASGSTGYVMQPVYSTDGSGRYSFQPVLGANGQPVQTSAGQFTQAQIQDLATKNVLQAAQISGKIQDPQTGQWIQTPAALLQAAQTALTGAQTTNELAQPALEAGKLTGTYQGQDTLEKQGQLFTQGLDAGKLSGIYGGNPTLDAQRLSLDTTTGLGNLAISQQDEQFKQQQALAQALADPTRFVEGNALANLYGTTRGGQLPQGASLVPQGIGAPATGDRMLGPAAGAPGAGTPLGMRPVRGVNPGGLPVGLTQIGAPATGGQAPAAFASATPTTAAGTPATSTLDPNLPLSPELRATLAGRMNPAFGNPNGVSGSLQSLSSLKGIDYSKLNPAAFSNMTQAGQKQYASLAQATTGIAPADLSTQISRQLPGANNQLPAAYGP